MGNLINPPSSNPINCPIEVACDVTGLTSVQLLVGADGQFFNGLIYKKPGNTYIGVDVQPYLRHLTNFDSFNINNTTSARYHLVNYGGTKSVQVYMYDGDTSVYSQLVHLIGHNLKYEDWLSFKTGQTFGRYKEYLNSTIIGNVLSNSIYYTGQPVVGNILWSYDDRVFNPSTFPLSTNYIEYRIVDKTDEDTYELGMDVSNYSFMSGNTYQLSYDIYQSSDEDSNIYFPNGNVYSINSGKWYTFNETITYNQIVTSGLTTVRYVYVDGFPGYVRFKNIKLIGSTKQTWTLDATALDDYFMQHYIYTYQRQDVNPFERIWNRSLKGAPVNIQIGNISTQTKNAQYRYTNYNDKLEYSGVTSTSWYSNFMSFRYLYNMYVGSGVTTTSDYYSFDYRLSSSSTNIRSIFIEQVDPSCLKDDAYQLYWVNRRGGYDWIIMSGKSVRSKNIERFSYNLPVRSFNGTTFTGGLDKIINKQYLSESEYSYQLNSELLTDTQFKWLEDLLDSPVVYLYSDKDKSIRSVVIEDNSYTFNKNRNDGMKSFSIRVKQPYKEKFIG